MFLLVSVKFAAFALKNFEKSKMVAKMAGML